MKQTNNAIKFLMAQYRAIFKNANLKMFLAAATAAAALSAGQAHAQNGDGVWDLADFSKENGAQNTLKAETVTKKSELDMSKFGQAVDDDGFSYAGNSGSDPATNNPTVLSGTDAVVTVIGAKDKHLAVAGLTLEKGASLTITNTDKTNTKLFGYTSGSSASGANFGNLKVSDSTIAGTKTALKFQSGSISNSSLTLDGLLLAEKNDGKFTDWDWIVSSNVGITKSGTAGGALEVSGSTINLNSFSNLQATDSITLSGSTVNFNGSLYQDKAGDTVKDTYASTLLIAGNNTISGTITLENSTVLNASNGFGGLYADTIAINSASATIGKDKQLILDGKWSGDKAAHDAKNNAHSAATINIKNFTTSGDGTLVVGHAKTTGTTTISGSVVINSNLENHSAITVSGNAGYLEVDAGMLAKDAGIFKGESGSLTVSGGTLSINGYSGNKTIDLADDKQIAFANKAARNKVVVTNSGTIEAENVKISKKIAGLADNTALSIHAENLTLGSAEFDSTAENALGIGSGSLVTENVSFLTKDAKPFVLKNNLALVSQGKGTISGSLQIGDSKTAGQVEITGGEYTLEAGKDLLITSGSGNEGLVIEDGSLSVSGKLTTTATNGIIKLSDGVLDASKATAYEFGAKTIQMAEASSLHLDGSKWFTLGDTTNDLVKFKDKVDAKAVSGNTISTLYLTGVGSMTMEQFKELKTDTGFTGLFEGFNVTTNDKVSGSVEFGKVETGTPGSVYHDAQATVNAAITDKTVSVGSLQLASGTGSLSITSTTGSNLTLTNAGANGNTNNNFVQKDDGKTAADVSLSGSKTVLVLQGAGNIGSIDATTAKDGALIVGSFDGSKTGDVTVKGDIGKNQQLGVVQASYNSDLTVDGTVVQTNEFHVMQGGSFTANKADITIGGSGDEVTLMGDVTAKSLKFSANNEAYIAAGNAKIKVDSLTLSSGGSLQVGDDSVGGLGATVVTKNLNLNSGSIFVDPSYGNPAALVLATNLSGGSTNDAGELNGDVFIGQNAAMGIGFDTEDEFKSTLSEYVDAKNGSFSDAQGKFKNALVINDNISIKTGNGIVLDASLKTEKLDTSKKPDTVAISKGSNFIITDAALKDGAAAVTFKNAGTVENNGSISLAGDLYSGDIDLANVVLFKANGTGPLTVSGSNKYVELAGGLYKFELTSGGKLEKMAINPEVEKQVRSQTSAPVGQFIVDYTGQKLDVSAKNKTLNDLIDDKNWVGVDAAAHAATYAGAQQAAVAAVGTMAEAVGGRVGSIGAEVATISATGSQANGGVWLSPMYKSVDADGFAAQGVSYGADVDLAGVAFGADTVNGNMRFGAVFNIGSGDSDGKGNGNGLKDEFDYYGFGMYSVMGFGNFALVGDASLNVISHDVEGLGFKGEADTTAVTMGVTGQYTISNPVVDVTPHLGARFIRLDTESYDLMGADGVVATTDFEVQNVFSVPLGVTLSKAFEMGGWSLAPSADLTLTFNAGDTEVDSTSRFSGINSNIGLSTEVLDEVTYGVALGLGAQYGAFGTNIGINYTGSENADSFGVNANARYMF